MHGELRANPQLSSPGAIDERNEALRRIFQDTPPTPQASQVLSTARPADLIQRMGDVQRMRTLRSNFQGTWPFTGGTAPTPAGPRSPTAPPVRPGGPTLRLVEDLQSTDPARQAIDHQTNKADVMQRVKGLRRYRLHLPVGSDVETPGDEALMKAESMLQRFQPGRTPPTTAEVEAFLDDTDAEYKTNPGANDNLKPGEIQLMHHDPDLFLSQFELDDEGRWARQESTG